MAMPLVIRSCHDVQLQCFADLVVDSMLDSGENTLHFEGISRAEMSNLMFGECVYPPLDLGRVCDLPKYA